MPNTLYITEYANAAPAGSIGPIGAPQAPALAEQHVQVSGSSVSSAALNAKTTIVMVSSNVDACLAIGVAPVADPLSQRMPANTTRFYGVPAGGTFSIAVITPT